jgi:hypothetical protein
MTRLKLGFKSNKVSNIEWYDLREDWALIEASLAKQYSIRIRRELDMPWTEFCTLVAGLMPDTPLGQIVSIRAEQDEDIVRNFSSDQRRIYDDWQKKVASKKLENKEELDKEMKELEYMLASMFGREE